MRIPIQIYVTVSWSSINSSLDHISLWKRYIDDTFYYVKIGTVNGILIELNDFHQSTPFIYELEKVSKSAFLDVLLIPNKDTIETTFYRKPTNSDIYLN